MRCIYFVIIILLVVPIFCIYSFGDPGDDKGPENDNTVTKGVTANEVYLKVTIPREVFAGSAYNVQLNVSNESANRVLMPIVPFNIELTKILWEQHLKKDEKTWIEVPHTAYTRRVILGPFGDGHGSYLEPGEEKQLMFSLSRYFDLTLAGKYKLTIGKKFSTQNWFPIVIGDLEFMVVSPPWRWQKVPKKDDGPEEDSDKNDAEAE